MTGFTYAPNEPTEEMWGGLARDIVFWCRFTPHDGASLHRHLRDIGTPIPDWLLAEIPDTSTVPPKGTVAACIYKAMLEAAEGPKPEHVGKEPSLSKNLYDAGRILRGINAYAQAGAFGDQTVRRAAVDKMLESARQLAAWLYRGARG